jgi:ATP-dependent RNA helicase DeaD
MRTPPPSKDRGQRDDRSSSRPDRGPRKERPSRAGSGGPMASYRIAVGKRHKVEPRQIVGALANEGGLGRGDFGRIDIRPDFSLVELPAELSGDTWDSLRTTRISGKLIELRKADAGDAAGARDDRPARSYGDHGKKPRHKS